MLLLQVTQAVADSLQVAADNLDQAIANADGLDKLSLITQQLLDAGVQIYEYTPGFVHAKVFTSDDRKAVVGTINMDYRSLYLHMECAVLMVGCSALDKLKLDCIVTMEKSHRVTLQDCKNRKHSLIWQAILRTISPLL